MSARVMGTSIQCLMIHSGYNCQVNLSKEKRILK